MKNKNYWRRTAVMFGGVLFLALGIALMQVSKLGTDPSNAQVIAIGEYMGISFAALRIVVNLFWAVPELLLTRKLIGIGTFFNWFLVGHLATWFNEKVLISLELQDLFFLQLLFMLIGVTVLSLGVALYQTADVGVAPYDALAILFEKYTPIPYYWCRIIVDSVCVLVALCFNGPIGIGTVICALGLGPLISFFSKTVGVKLCNSPSS